MSPRFAKYTSKNHKHICGLKLTERNLFKKMLIHLALNELQADKVDVNEQNEKVYENFGFVTHERTEKDSNGKDYPILEMVLSKKKGKSYIS